MKVIDMLNDLVNDKVVYPYIKYYNRSSKSYEIMLNCEENIINKLDQGNITLYDEIEGIVEHEEEPQEHKIPDKIFLNQDYGSCYIDPYSYKQVPLKREKLSPEEVSIINKINEILDYFEEKE